MIELSKAKRLIDDGFSIITVSNNKIPNFKWKKYQTEQVDKNKFEYYYNYKGGIINKSTNKEIPPTENIGIVTGYDYLECIDIDLKVFSTAKEQKDFWDEYLEFLEDNIYDFKDKFVIAKTKNNGFHILYKTKRVEGNLKIAKLKGHKEAIIETRGIGGYIFVYENFLNGKSYSDIDYISDEDREILFSCSRTYDYIDAVPEAPVRKKTVYIDGELTPWDDYNNKTSIFDIIGDEFEIKNRLETSKKYVIKRHGAKSVHSGYVFKDSMCMYLFSTGTIYPHEKLISPFYAFSIKYHGGDMSAAASELYKQGFGSRIKKSLEVSEHEIIKPDVEIDKESLKFPLDIFPLPIQAYITEASETLNNSIDYMSCSLLWLISTSIGNALKIEVVEGWNENATIWMSIVGKAGWGKTPSIKRIISPIQKLNSRNVKNYYKELEKYEAYEALTKKEKQNHEEITKPTKSQFIANDITLEALVDLHGESDNSVGVFKDELAGWFKDMNKYRQGSDLEFWLSAWSGSPVILTRVTRKGSYIERPSIPVLGGIQPTVLNSFNTSENKENGFMDRMLLCYPDLQAKYLSKKRMDLEKIIWYNDTVVRFYETIKIDIVTRDKYGEIEPLICRMTDEAYNMYDNRHKEITDIENDDHVNEYLKSMLPKQKAYIARFALLINTFDSFFNDSTILDTISVETMDKAIRLSNYFIETAKKVKVTATEINEYKRILDLNKNKTRKEQFEAIYKIDEDFNRTEVSELLGVSRMSIIRWIKEIDKK